MVHALSFQELDHDGQDNDGLQISSTKCTTTDEGMMMQSSNLDHESCNCWRIAATEGSMRVTGTQIRSAQSLCAAQSRPSQPSHTAPSLYKAEENITADRTSLSAVDSSHSAGTFLHVINSYFMTYFRRLCFTTVSGVL